MQLIVACCKTVEDYITQEAHLKVRAPERCPRCGKLQTLTHLGYYPRGCTDSEGKIREISVARFECEDCGVTVSCLPDFAQPYRMVNSRTIEKSFNGDTTSVDVERNRDTLRRYWRSFADMARRLRQVVGCALGRAPPKEPAAGLWRRIMAKWRTLTQATLHMTQEYHATCFGMYRCHKPGFAGCAR